MKIKLTFLLFLFPLIAINNRTSFGKNIDFQILSATQQTIIGGAFGSPKVTNYSIKLKALRTFTITTDSGYAEEKIDKLTISNDSNQVVQKKLCKKGKTYTLYFSIITPISTNSNFPKEIFKGSNEQKLPIKSPTGIAVKYKGGKSKYLVLNKIIKNLDVFAP